MAICPKCRGPTRKMNEAHDICEKCQRIQPRTDPSWVSIQRDLCLLLECPSKHRKEQVANIVGRLHKWLEEQNP